MKMSPGAGFFFLKMRSEGGVRSGREWKCWTPLGLPPGSGIRCSLPELMNRAIVNVTAPLRAPTSGAPARTVTLSPGLNGFVRTKLAPCPSECDLSTPVWAPVFEPVTCTVPSALGDAPRKLTWVCGEATGVPAVGYTATGGVAPPELLASTSAPLEPTTMPAIADTARRFESTDHLSLDGDEKGGTIGETRETNLSCARSTRPAVSSDGAAKESNLPSEGLPRRHGFEDRMGHQTRAAPWASLRLGTSHAGLAEISPADSSAPPAGRTTSCRRRFRLG